MARSGYLLDLVVFFEFGGAEVSVFIGALLRRYGPRTGQPSCRQGRGSWRSALPKRVPRRQVAVVAGGDELVVGRVHRRGAVELERQEHPRAPRRWDVVG